MTGNETATRPDSASRQSDALLWAAAAAVGAIGVTWLLMLQPWRADEPDADTAPASEQSAAATVSPSGASAPEKAATATQLESQIDDPLATAELALEAGMLVEPESHSAWSLYSSVLEQDPDNEAALAGRARVAERLVARADTALEQDRTDDARAIGERILGAIPDHAAARRLIESVEAATAAARPETEPEPELDPAPGASAPAADAAAADAAPDEPAHDPEAEAFDEAHASFEQALGSGRLLTPADASARHFVDVMLEIDADAERALNARAALFEALLARSSQAVDELDAAAARTWIDEAEELGVDADAVERARTQLVDALVARESRQRLPVSSFELTEYVPPVYPSVAERRGIEGWVEVELTVASDGTTRDIAIVDGSHDAAFHDVTIEAVREWRFEPREFMGQAIDQQAFTRIRFDLD